MAEPMRAEPLTIALHNDYEVVVRGLQSMLEPFADRVRVVELDSRMPVSTPVDITLYDTFGRAQVDGEDIDDVLSNHRGGKTVIYTWNMQPVLIDQAIAKGCHGYLDKGVTGPRLVEALERIYAGEIIISSMRPLDGESQVDGVDGQDGVTDHGHDFLDGHEIRTFDTGDWPGRQAKLSAREAEVLALITQGYTNNDIAERSYLSINSVKSYIRSAYRKIGVERRSQAVRWGMENGLQPDINRTIIH